MISRLIPPQCGDTGEGIWHQLVSINMSSANSQCPEGWVEENEGGVRACGRGTVAGGSCKSAFFNSQMQYTRVCGRVIGYQNRTTDAFAQRSSRVTIDEIYVDGLSITYGSPRQHLWTFAAGVREGLEVLNQVVKHSTALVRGIQEPLLPCIWEITGIVSLGIQR